jgi:hypothetical protein
MIFHFADLAEDRDVRDWTVFAAESIAEARKFGKPVIAWLSPSVRGFGLDHVEREWFRQQLEFVAPLVDGIAIYNNTTLPTEVQQTMGWWQATTDFTSARSAPSTTLEVTVK